MQPRFAISPNTGMIRCFRKLKLALDGLKATRQVTQLSMYSRNVPKFDARVIVNSEFGSAAILSWVLYPKLEKKPCGRVLIVASVGAVASPNTMFTYRHPTTPEIAASVQMARCGVRFFECSMPKCSGTSLSLPIA